MSQARTGDTVSIHYIGTLDDGRIFHCTDEGEPLRFTLGEGDVFPALEEAVLGMRPGEAKSVTIPSGKAYGPRRRENVAVLRREELPEGVEPRVGQKVRLTLADGKKVLMRVTHVSEEAVTFDANHPLAGRELTFALQLVAVD